MLKSILSFVLILSLLPVQQTAVVHGSGGTHSMRPHFHLSSAANSHHPSGCVRHDHDETSESESRKPADHDGDAVYLSAVDVGTPERMELEPSVLSQGFEVDFRRDDLKIGCSGEFDRCFAKRTDRDARTAARPLYVLHMSYSI